MATSMDFHWGDWVRCHDRIMVVYEAWVDRPVGLVPEDPVLEYDDETGLMLPKVEYYPPEELEVLSPVRVSKDILRSFLRMELTPWQLAAQGKYPFHPASGSFELQAEDLEALERNLHKADIYVMDAWERCFATDPDLCHVTCHETDPGGFSLCFFWEEFLSAMGWFNIEDQDPSVLTDLLAVYRKNRHRPLDSLDLNDKLKMALINRIRHYADSHPINEIHRRAYLRYLDQMCAENDRWAVSEKAYAYYGGNSVVPCDWQICAKTLMQLLELGDPFAANSLGYIYYSSRLGEPDYEKALHYFRIAADHGIVEAIYKCSDMYRKGHGTALDPLKAWDLLWALYPDQLRYMQRELFDCKYADIALRIGYCYEDGIGTSRDYSKAHEFYERARYAIEMRIRYDEQFGDRSVQKNIQKALERIRELDPQGTVRITDLPGYH